MVGSEELMGLVSLLYHYTRKMELELTCPSCSNMLRMPTVLPCNHVFCSQCILTKDYYQYKCPACMSIFVRADLRHSAHMEEMIRIFKSMNTSMEAIFQKLHSLGAGMESPSKECVDLGHERTGDMRGAQVTTPRGKMPSVESCIVEHNNADETPGTKGPLPIDRPVSGHNNVDKCVGPSRASEVLCGHQSGVSVGMNVHNEESIAPRNGSAKRKLQEAVTWTVSGGESRYDAGTNTPLDSKSKFVRYSSKKHQHNVEESKANCNKQGSVIDTMGSPLGEPRKVAIDEIKVQTGDDVMLLTPESSVGMIQHSGITKSSDNLMPTFPPEAGSTTKSKRPTKGSELGSKTNNQSLHTQHSLLDDKTETKEKIKANTPLSPQINSTSLRPCISDEKREELRREALGVCSKWILCGSDLSTSEEKLLVGFASLTGSSVTGRCKKNTTHVIVSTDARGACKKTLKVLKAILNGQWVLTIEWVKACMKDGKVVPEERYEVCQIDLGERTCFNGPKKGRLNAINKAPKILSGLRFYFSDQFELLDRGVWEDLVVDAGATVLRKDELTHPPAKLSSLESSYIVVNEGFQAKWSKDELREAVTKRSDEAVDLKLKTGFQIIGHTDILDTIAACNSAADLAKCVLLQ